MASSSNRDISPADPRTITSKLLVGYQGWFTCAGDGAPIEPHHHGWLHWFDQPIPNGGGPKFDLFPDVSDYTAEELYPAPGLTLSDGQPAKLFSSRNLRTVQRHFQWMAEHGIDGAFFQRFGTEIQVHSGLKALKDEVCDRVREAADLTGRVWAVMYDVSGLDPAAIEQVICQDWLALSRRVLSSPMYLHEQGRPVLGLWGLGFRGQSHDPASVVRLVQTLRTFTPGGLYIWGGVPYHWRLSKGDMDPNPAFLDIYQSHFDALSPWTIGRYRMEDLDEGAVERKLVEDFQYLSSGGPSYFPTIWPGESSLNLSNDRPLNDHPRLRGDFLWRQLYHAKRAGAKTVYLAMFDEYDESTAILPAVALKRNLPSGGKFIALDADGDLSLPSDWYLKIAAFAAEVMRGQREIEKTLPRKMLLGDYWGSRKRGPAASPSGSSGSTSTYVPNQTKVQEQVSSAFASAPTGAAAPADTGSWQDVKDTKDDEPPPPAYTLEAGEQAKAPSATDAPSAATRTSQPPLSVALTAGDSSHNRASTVSANGPTTTMQGSVGLGRSSSQCASQSTPISTTQPLAPWAPPPATHQFASPPSVPPHTFSPPSMGPTYTPPHSPSSYNSAVSSLSNDFSRMNTGPLVSPPSSPTKPGNQSEFPFNWPTEAGQTHQYTHYTASQSTHQSEHVHSGSHGLPSPGPGGWTASAAPAAPPPGTHSVSSQYPHHFSPATQTQQWGQPPGPPPTSGGSTEYMGNLGASSPSPYQPPSSCLGASSQPQPVNPEHGPSPSETSSYPGVKSPWQAPQPATSTCAGVQQNIGQNPPTDQSGTLYAGQSQPGYYPGHTGTSYAPPPGPPPPGPPPPGPPPPPHGASGSGPQTQVDPNYPNKLFASLAPTYHSGFGSYHDYSPRIDPVPSLSGPGGFRSDLIDFNYGYGTELPRATLPGANHDAVLHPEFSSHDSGTYPQPGGSVASDAPSYGHRFNDNDPGGNPPWVGGFGAFR